MFCRKMLMRACVRAHVSVRVCARALVCVYMYEKIFLGRGWPQSGRGFALRTSRAYFQQSPSVYGALRPIAEKQKPWASSRGHWDEA